MTAKGPGSQPLHAVPVLGGDDHKRTKTATQGDLWGGARTWLIGAWALLAGLPMLVAALVFAIKQPVLLIDGDGASNEFALINAGHFAQLVGNYSRYGWFQSRARLVLCARPRLPTRSAPRPGPSSSPTWF